MVAARRYRITPWPVRVLVPFLAFVIILAVIANHSAPAVVVPIVVLLAAAYIYAAERIGLYVTDWGIESRMTRRENSFRFAWGDIDRFDLAEGRSQIAVVMHLRAGKQMILPSTRAWAYDRKNVERIYQQLERDRTAAQSPGTAAHSPDTPPS